MNGTVKLAIHVQKLSSPIVHIGVMQCATPFLGPSVHRKGATKGKTQGGHRKCKFHHCAKKEEVGKTIRGALIGNGNKPFGIYHSIRIWRELDGERDATFGMALVIIKSGNTREGDGKS